MSKPTAPPKNQLGAAMFSKAKPKTPPKKPAGVPPTAKAGVAVRQTTGGDDGS